MSALDIVSSTLGLAGGIAEAAGSVTALTQIPGVITALVGDGIGLGSDITAATQLGFPDCEAEFTGTILGHADLVTSLGIQAFDDAITLGNPDGLTYSSGIAIGGGSVSGARQGTFANAGATSAIALGNGASASGVRAIGIGEPTGFVPLGRRAWMTP